MAKPHSTQRPAAVEERDVDREAHADRVWTGAAGVSRIHRTDEGTPAIEGDSGGVPIWLVVRVVAVLVVAGRSPWRPDDAAPGVDAVAWFVGAVLLLAGVGMLVSSARADGVVRRGQRNQGHIVSVSKAWIDESGRGLWDVQVGFRRTPARRCPSRFAGPVMMSTGEWASRSTCGSTPTA